MIALLIAAAGTGFTGEPGSVFRELPDEGAGVIELTDGVVWAETAPFRDGVIEADILMDDGRGFTGLLFRAPDAGNGELFYFRHHQRGLPDAWQYHPRHNGHQAYQIYQGPGFAGAFDTPVGRWSRIRLELHGRSARVLVDGEEAAFLHALQNDPVSGKFGLWALGGERLIRNVSFTGLTEAEAGELARRSTGDEAGEVSPARLIDVWQVSLPVTLDKAMAMIDQPAEGLRAMAPVHRGIVDLNQAGAIVGEASSVLARAEIESEEGGLAWLDLAFSDEARVFLNGEPLFSGSDRFRSRDYRFLGTMGFFDRLALRLEAGTNRLDVIVTEVEGGWGIGGRVEADQGFAERRRGEPGR